MQWCILILTYFTTFTFVLGLYYLVFWRRITILNRIKLHIHNSAIDDDFQQAPSFSIKKDIRKITGFIKKIIPQKAYLNSKRKKLAQAAVLMKPEEFIMICLGVGIVLGVFFFLIFNSIVFVPIGIAIGYYLPNLFLESSKNRRAKKLNSQLPDALSIIANGLRAGFGIVQAMSVASKELQEPISVEFEKVVRDNSLGKPLEEALAEMANRSEDEDLGMFVTAMLIQRQVGGNLSEILDSISRTIRERVKIRGEIKTLTSQSRFSAVIISAMPIAIAIAIALLNPKYIGTLVKTQTGIIMIIAAVILDVLGIIALKKIVDIKI